MLPTKDGTINVVTIKIQGGQSIITNDANFGPNNSFKNSINSTLDTISPRSFMKIYCACGCIVGLDRNEILLKQKLGKEVECITCRNLRISSEIDEMNSHFDGISNEDELWSF